MLTRKQIRDDLRKHAQVYYLLGFVFLSCMIAIFTSTGDKEEKAVIVKKVVVEGGGKSMEYAYACGQADLLRGKKRVKFINDSTIIWIESPWDSKRKPDLDTIIVGKQKE